MHTDLNARVNRYVAYLVYDATHRRRAHSQARAVTKARLHAAVVRTARLHGMTEAQIQSLIAEARDTAKALAS